MSASDETQPDLPRPPWPWRNGHMQTIWAAKLALTSDGVAPSPGPKRSRWSTPDGDFVDVDTWLGEPEAPTVVLFHGLEGDSSSHYVRAFAHLAHTRRWTLRVPHFRGCSGEMNLRPRLYHAGDHEEIAWILARAKFEANDAPLFAVGISLGGNALTKHLARVSLSPALDAPVAAAVIGAPLDLRAASEAIERGLNRYLYTPMFLRSMRQKAERKWAQFPTAQWRAFAPELDMTRVRAARTIRDFDDAFTAPLHGFDGVEDYWHRASAKPDLATIAQPCLMVHAQDDPFVPVASVRPHDLQNKALTWWQPRWGGHVGFVHATGARRWRGGIWRLPGAVVDWLDRQGGQGG